MKFNRNVIIIGGGPAGMMAAIACKQFYPKSTVVLIERNDCLGKKLRLTGGGRCNLTANVNQHEIIKNTPHHGKFLFSALNQFSTQDIQQFFITRGCLLKEEDHQRIFPVSDQAQDVIDVLKRELEKLQVEIQLNCLVEAIDYSSKSLLSSCGKWTYDHLIFATGGKSYAVTGSDGTAFELIKASNHTITPLFPAEVPLVSHDAIIQSKSLQGLSFKDCMIQAYVNEKKTSQVCHDLIITHFGISGPAALQTSSFLTQALKEHQTIKLVIDFCPDITYEQLKDEMQNLTFEQCMLNHRIPRRLIQVIQNTPELNQNPILSIKQFPLNIHGCRGFSSAFVTSGGVQIAEISPKTMKSKLLSSLSFCGEALDINSLTGGYNMSVAFTTGFCAGKHACSNE